MNWLSILGGIPEAVGNYVTKKMELREERLRQQREFEQAIHTRKLDLISQGLTADMNWEMEFARQAEHSWKDEYTLIVISIPAIAAFVKTSWFDGPAIVKAGFEALSGTPLWYQTVLITLFLATVGIRYWRRTQSDT